MYLNTVSETGPAFAPSPKKQQLLKLFHTPNTHALVQFSSVQYGVCPMHSKNPVCTPPHLSEAPQSCPDGVMSLTLHMQVVSQAPQHFGSSEMQATCDGCFACQSIGLVISLHSSMSRARTSSMCSTPSLRHSPMLPLK